MIDAVPGDEIHNFIGHGGIIIGANWDKESVREHIRRPDLRLGLIFSPQPTQRHHLVAISEDQRWSFDVGEIDETRMLEEILRQGICPRQHLTGLPWPPTDAGRWPRP